MKEIGGLPDGFVIASKADRDPDTNDFSGDQVRRCLERSLTLLGIDHIPLYYLHDPEHVGFETTMALDGAVETLAGLKSEGVIGHVGVAAGPVDLLTRYIRTGAFDVVLIHNRYTAPAVRGPRSCAGPGPGHSTGYHPGSGTVSITRWPPDVWSAASCR